MSPEDKARNEIIQSGLRIIKPHPPAKARPFQELPILERAVFILHLSGFSQRQILKTAQDLIQIKPTRWKIRYFISKGYEKYPDIKKP